MVYVGKKAPDVKTSAVLKREVLRDFSLSGYGKGRNYTILFFYPQDFTYVCPTEINGFQDKKEEFDKLGAVIVGCSVDSCDSHASWLRTPIKEGGIEGVEFPIIADETKELAKEYGVLGDDGKALRGLFIIDREGILQHATINNSNVGRNVDEVLRTLQALKFTEEHGGMVCPASWKPGQEAIKVPSK